MSDSPAIATAEALLRLIEKSRLLTPDQMAEVRKTYGQEPDPRAIARRMVRHGWLTRWQAEQLMAGRNSFRFGQYTLLSRIGKGNMGAVFEARHPNHTRSVALKIMGKSVLKDPVMVARFQREMRNVAMLDHPNIVTFYDAGKHGSTNFLAMEFVHGRDLRDLLRDHPRLPIDFSCECIRQAALGLQHAHELGLIHRDIKPDNLLVQLDSHGQPVVKVLDMGLAKMVDAGEGQDASLTMRGELVGTPNYVAPELILNPENPDIRADIYGLGGTLFRLISGKLAIQGNSALEKLANRVKYDAPSILTHRPEVGDELAAIVAKMLAREPSDRYQTPLEVAQALEPFAWKPGSPPPPVSLVPIPPDETEVVEIEQGVEEDAPETSLLPPPIPNGHGAAVAASSVAGAKPAIQPLTQPPLQPTIQPDGAEWAVRIRTDSVPRSVQAARRQSQGFFSGIVQAVARLFSPRSKE